MRYDLLDAQACVDWAVDQLPSLEARINAWLCLNVVVEVEDAGAEVPNNVLVAVRREELPRSFNVEIGAYLDTMRSSLDILASVLAGRYGVCAPENAYFPITRSEARFRAKGSRSANFVAGLPPAERKRLEALKPYHGGNDDLWSLHQLDMIRKHRRLLTVIAEPDFFSVEGTGVYQHFTPVATGFMRADNVSERKVVLGLMAKDAPPYGMKLLDWARRQGALSWELRAATSLARLWRDQHRVEEARALLGRFTAASPKASQRLTCKQRRAFCRN